MRDAADLDWHTLLARLEADLQARRLDRPGTDFDDAAWAEARRRVDGYARRVMARDIGLRNDVDDAVQAVLLKLQSLDNVQQLRSRASPVGYLIVMIRNAAMDIVRRRQRQGRLDVSAVSSGGAVNVDDELEGAERVRRLHAALARLSPEDKSLIERRFWGHRTIGQIAAERGATYSATAVRLWRILRRLAAELPNDDWPGGGTH